MVSRCPEETGTNWKDQSTTCMSHPMPDQYLLVLQNVNYMIMIIQTIAQN